MEHPIIRAEKVEKFYAQPRENRIQVIAPTDLSICKGQIVAFLGPSGSGDARLLRMLTGLSTPSIGKVFWHGKPMAQLVGYVHERDTVICHSMDRLAASPDRNRALLVRAQRGVGAPPLGPHLVREPRQG